MPGEDKHINFPVHRTLPQSSSTAANVRIKVKGEDLE
jgi:hypothetical protein